MYLYAKFNTMAKAIVNFYWNGVLVEKGMEAPEGAPSSLVEKVLVKKTKERKRKTETK